MTRSVPEWIAKHDDTPAPPRVRLRIFEAFDGRCACCGRKIGPGEKWDLDHIVALINGGENMETNLRPVLQEHHKAKTRADLAAKSHSYKRRLSHAGIRPKGRSFATNRNGPFKRKINGRVERR